MDMSLLCKKPALTISSHLINNSHLMTDFIYIVEIVGVFYCNIL